MEQLSRPYQIALGAILLLAVAWFLALKPNDAVSEPAAAPPGVAGLGSAVAKAEGASAASDANAAATAAASAAASGEAPAAGAAPAVASPGGSSRVPASTSAAARAAAADAKAARKDPSRKVLDWLDRGKVAVVTFYARGGADDKAVRRTLKSLNRHDGDVRVFAADIAKVGSYEAITRGVAVLQAPTTLVISPDRRARKLVGYLDRAEVQQRVDDVLADLRVTLRPSVLRGLRKQAGRVCGKGKGDAATACRAHLAEVNRSCASATADALRIGIDAARAGQDKASIVAPLLQRATELTDSVADARPPAAQAGEHAFLVKSMRKELAAMKAVGPDPAALAAMKPDRAAEARARKAGYGACTTPA